MPAGRVHIVTGRQCHKAWLCGRHKTVPSPPTARLSITFWSIAIGAAIVNTEQNGVVYNDGLQDILIWTSNVPGSAAPGEVPTSSPAPGAPPAPAS